ncbi:MAG: segregation and condensation protein [Chloroflexota bacterium]|nr:segregation and condensation protein [Chloroflexota bacterium]
MTDAYQVRLPIFEGPLDLLLQLIEREKLDISVVTIASVTDQFLTYVRQLEAAQPGILADFLVMAARLVWIKSRILLPQPAQGAEEAEEDPAEALARQLKEYKRFKEAAKLLREIEERGLHTYPRVAPPPELDARLAEGGVTLADLVAAAQSALAGLPPMPQIPAGVVVPFTLTIRDQIGLIREKTSGGRSVTFRSLLQYARQRVEIIVTLLAVLELIKRREINAAQEALFGEIMIVPAPDAEARRAEITDLFVESGNGET